MPTFAGYQQYDLGGAVQGTPLPGQIRMPPPYSALPAVGEAVPASYSSEN
jgi:hypothetical protein